MYVEGGKNDATLQDKYSAAGRYTKIMPLEFKISDRSDHSCGDLLAEA